MMALLILLLSALSGFSASYYVDADRPNDLSDGLTFATAWKTVSKVNATSFAAGDIILFDSDEWAERLSPATSGTAGNYITFGRYNASGARPTFRAAASGRPEAITLVPGRTYIKLSFLNLVGGDLSQADGLLESDSILNVAEDCTFDGEDAADNCVGGSITLRRFYITGARDDGFTQHQTNDSLLEDGEITGCTQGINNSGTAMNLTVNRVYIHNNTTAEIGPLSATTATFNWCRIKGVLKLFDGCENTATFAYCTFDFTEGGTVNPEFNTLALTVANNCAFVGTSTGNGSGKFGISNAAFNATNCIFYGLNICANLFTGGTFNKDHCITFDVTSGTVTANTSPVSTSDPLFFDVAAQNFRLLAGSPAIDSGIDLGFTIDLDGNAVGNPPDLGAYAYFSPPPDFTGQIRLRKSPISSARRR